MERYVIDFIQIIGKVDNYEDIVCDVGNYLEENTQFLGWDSEGYACHGHCDDANKMENDIHKIVNGYERNIDEFEDNPAICIYYPDRSEMTQVWDNGFETYFDYDYDNGGLQRFFELYHPFTF